MNFNVLLEKPRNKVLLLIFLVFFALTIISIGLLFPVFLGQFPVGAGLMDIKNAWTKANMDTIISIWNADPSKDYVSLMFMVHMVDLLFMAIYGTAIFSGLLLVARGLPESSKLQKMYLYLSFLAWIAVVLDLFEEYHILVMLADPSNITEFNAFGASLSATICSILIAVSLIFFIIGLMVILINHLKNR